jgi:hypothetical protein
MDTVVTSFLLDMAFHPSKPQLGKPVLLQHQPTVPQCLNNNNLHQEPR